MRLKKTAGRFLLERTIKAEDTSSEDIATLTSFIEPYRLYITTLNRYKTRLMK